MRARPTPSAGSRHQRKAAPGLEALGLPIADGAVGEQRGVAATAGCQQRIAASDIDYLEFDAHSAKFDLGFPALEADLERLRAAGASIGRTPGGRNMTATHIGPYDTVSETYSTMDRAMQAQGLTGSKDMWESYLSPPDTPPEQTRTDVIWPLLTAAVQSA
jgi:hypothetical protein